MPDRSEREPALEQHAWLSSGASVWHEVSRRSLMGETGSGRTIFAGSWKCSVALATASRQTLPQCEGTRPWGESRDSFRPMVRPLGRIALRSRAPCGRHR